MASNRGVVYLGPGKVEVQSGSMGWPPQDSKPWTDQRSSATANNSTAALASAAWRSGYQ